MPTTRPSRVTPSPTPYPVFQPFMSKSPTHAPTLPAMDPYATTATMIIFMIIAWCCATLVVGLVIAQVLVRGIALFRR